MEVATIVAIVTATLTGLGVGVTLIVLMVRGGFLTGKLVTQVEGLTAAVNELRAEVQQSNQILVALASHTRDTDGRTVFQVPTVTSR